MTLPPAFEENFLEYSLRNTDEATGQRDREAVLQKTSSAWQTF